MVSSETQPDAWSSWQELTSARIALGRAGGSLPTREWLKFSLAHARARDAVHVELDSKRLSDEMQSLGWETIVVASQAHDRTEMLQRPDRGRKLRPDDAIRLQQIARTAAPGPSDRFTFDLAILVADGLSAVAAQAHAVGLLKNLLPPLHDRGWRISPIVIVHQGRVALQDEAGSCLNARLILSLIGERPGLGSPDSLGAYFVYEPRPGRNDAQRNCVSNIRPDGLPLPAAADTLIYLLTASHTRRLSGVDLKDDRVLLKDDSNPIKSIDSPPEITAGHS
ncbi:ethanolamine ammonia-lyase subunit EutC [Planctopirus hydrillae]|uniref:Ethanolamine ammonia-lyase small subunit n=1 Tax=Planctopirus hydrillae TaxID=1841610 RepID=A0A1C3EHC4_9PLAN|nr:ethanolamine ammonia-lyase subunit EutC [Planctopirus hydrillae]ODA32645.1 ethanolamine ammonia-lyase [Planctopirus hydrillae]